jgi:hypothetical protein
MRKQILLTLLIVVTAVSLMSCAAPDSVVTAKIKTKMMADKAVSADKIEVDTRDGVVTLTGMVQSQEAKDHALRIARETNGARKVVDESGTEHGREDRRRRDHDARENTASR